jgi:hypothetical protein
MYGTILISTLIALSLSSCTIYRSPERKDFESEYPDFKVQNLYVKSCSNQSVIQNALATKLINIKMDEISLWEHLIEFKHPGNTSTIESVFESNNFKGEFCIYEYTQS